MDERLSTQDVLARNLKYLMAQRGWNQVETARRARVDQKTISNILAARKKAKIDIVDSIAKAFGLNGWQLILPRLIDDISGETSIAKVYEKFLQSSAEGKRHILSVAEREADYNTREAS
jgi:transcriptional regulator with XRE-family HTH domain